MLPKPVTGQKHVPRTDVGSVCSELMSRFNTSSIGMKLVFRKKNHWRNVIGTLPIHSVLLSLWCFFSLLMRTVAKLSQGLLSKCKLQKSSWSLPMQVKKMASRVRIINNQAACLFFLASELFVLWGGGQPSALAEVKSSRTHIWRQVWRWYLELFALLILCVLELFFGDDGRRLRFPLLRAKIQVCGRSALGTVRWQFLETERESYAFTVPSPWLTERGSRRGKDPVCQPVWWGQVSLDPLQPISCVLWL